MHGVLMLHGVHMKPQRHLGLEDEGRGYVNDDKPPILRGLNVIGWV